VAGSWILALVKKKGACFGFFGMVLWFAVFWAFVEFYASVCVCRAA